MRNLNQDLMLTPQIEHQLVRDRRLFQYLNGCSETGLLTRSILLKIARKLNWKKNTGTSKIRQTLLKSYLETREHVYQPYECGESSVIFTEIEKE